MFRRRTRSSVSNIPSTKKKCDSPSLGIKKSWHQERRQSCWYEYLYLTGLTTLKTHLELKIKPFWFYTGLSRGIPSHRFHPSSLPNFIHSKEHSVFLWKSNAHCVWCQYKFLVSFWTFPPVLLSLSSRQGPWQQSCANRCPEMKRALRSLLFIWYSKPLTDSIISICCISEKVRTLKWNVWESQIWYGFGSLWLNVIIFKGYIPNCALAVEAMLATASLGAIWSSTSPDFGVSVIDNNYCTFLKLNYLILKMYSWASTNGHLSTMASLFCFPGYVVVQFYPWFKFCFSLFWGMVIYDKEFKTKEN